MGSVEDGSVGLGGQQLNRAGQLGSIVGSRTVPKPGTATAAVTAGIDTCQSPLNHR